MIIDAELLPIKEAAKNGDPHAQLEMARVYLYGRGAPESISMARRYYKMLADHLPEEIDFIEYGALLMLIGNLAADEKNFKVANRWYEKSVRYIRENHTESYADKLIQDLGLEDIKVTEYVQQ